MCWWNWNSQIYFKIFTKCHVLQKKLSFLQSPFWTNLFSLLPRKTWTRLLSWRKGKRQFYVDLFSHHKLFLTLKLLWEKCLDGCLPLYGRTKTFTVTLFNLQCKNLVLAFTAMTMIFIIFYFSDGAVNVRCVVGT